MKVIEGGFGRQAPLDLAQRLRELADSVEAGDTSAAIIGYICDGEYRFLWGASLLDSMTLATLMQQTSIDNMRA